LFKFFGSLGTSKSRVVEYGGNFYGYGNRSGGQSFWPKDLVHINGDTVSYSFECRSGREQHTPENIVWGFAFTVYPVYDANAETIAESIGEVEKTEANTSVTTKTDEMLLNQQTLVEKSKLALDVISCSTSRLSSNILIRLVSSGSDDVSEDTGETVLPKYAIEPMLRTIGLVGEVLDIDPVNELILLEIYVETEGNLLRFWYPLKCLERLGGSKKPALNGNNVNLFKLHNNLMSLESSLSQLYCRTAFLRILNTCYVDSTESSSIPSSLSNSNSDAVESSRSRTLLSALEELDLENLKVILILTNVINSIIDKLCHITANFTKFINCFQLRSEHGFSDFPLNGDLLTWNLGFDVPSMKFLTDLGNPSVLFYR